MKLPRIKNLIFGFLIFSLIAGILVSLSFIAALMLAQPKTYLPEDVPPDRVGIVFGAGLLKSGAPSAVLRDRVETAVELYRSGKIKKLLMSGDNRFVNYNEPAAMRDYAIELGVPTEDIVLDYAGRRTYDTCYRARDIFKVDSAILITQAFHMPRALLTCNGLGLPSTGVEATVRKYRRSSYTYWYLREIPATAMAFWDVWVGHPLPVLGKEEPISFD